MSLPQNATTRYVNNLIRKGKNDDFELITLTREDITHNGYVVGNCYTVSIRRHGPNFDASIASGVTPEQAVRRALGKAGVTFK